MKNVLIFTMCALFMLFPFISYADAPDGMTTFTSVFVGDPTDDPTVTPGDDDVYIKGTLEVDGVVYIDAGLNRSELAQENLEVYTIPIGALMAADGAALGATDTEDSGDHYVSYASSEFRILGNSPNSDTQTDITLGEFPLPPEYVDGETVICRVNAQYTSAGDTNTLDLNCYEKVVADGSVVTDICATTVRTLSADGSNLDFTITPTNLVNGDLLFFKVTTAFQDSDGSTGEAQINSIQFLIDIKG